MIRQQVSIAKTEATPNDPTGGGATGNWSAFQEDTDGDGTWDLDQSRTHNAVNEITMIASSSNHIAHDRGGNTIKMPQPDAWASHYDLVYDAWNRLVTVADGGTPVAEYHYDGRNYRTTENSSGTPRHFYYSSRWQVLEERVGVLTSADRQFVWGLRYIDDLILRDRDTSDEGALDERFYALQDANWNVVAISSTTGTIQERCTYTAYGIPRFLTGSFGSRTSSVHDWETLYCGYRWDKTIASCHVRHRVLFSHLGRWNRRDPIGYEAGINLYEYVGDSPFMHADPFGLTWPHENPYLPKPQPLPPAPPAPPAKEPCEDCKESYDKCWFAATTAFLACCASIGESGVGFIACTIAYLAWVDSCKDALAKCGH